MKNILKFALIALSLGLMFTGCDKGGGGTTITDDSRDKVTGAYPVKVTAPVAGEIYTALSLVKDGDSDLKAVAFVTVPDMGMINIDLVLSELNEYKEENDKAVTGYMFKVAEQELTILGSSMTLRGTGAYTGGYDGKVYKGSGESFISFEIADDATGTLVIKVETGVPPVDPREKVLGTYPVGVRIDVLEPTPVAGTIQITKEGENNLNAALNFTYSDGVTTADIAIVLSDLKAYSDEGGMSVTGYYFKIASQEMTILHPYHYGGTGKYTDGYDGKLYKGADGTMFISFEIVGEETELVVNVDSMSK